MPTKHLKYGGSTFTRTMHCPAWQLLSKDAPKQKTSVFAEEGSLLHECMEVAATYGIDRDNLPARYGSVELTDELVETKLIPALLALNTVRERYDIGEEWHEPFVELIPDTAGGSIDVLGLSKDRKTMVVTDYKFGYNPVSVEENLQLLFYALCAAVDPQFAIVFKEITTVVLVIIQPTEDTEQPDFNCWECPVEKLDDFELEAYQAIDTAEASDGSDATPGPWCRYCPAQATCEGQVAAIQAALKIHPDNADALGRALTIADQFENWIATVRKQAHEQLELGVKIPGFKLVNKRPTRVWNDDEAVEKLIRNSKKVKTAEAHVSKLLSPAQMEKLFKSKGLDADSLTMYISSVSSGTTLAKASDKRSEALASGALQAAAQRLLNR